MGTIKQQNHRGGRVDNERWAETGRPSVGGQVHILHLLLTRTLVVRTTSGISMVTSLLSLLSC